MAIPLLFFFVSGTCALVYQVVWVRQLLLLAGTTTAAVTTVLGVFMAGLGAGAWLFGARADRSRSPLRLYAYLELGIGLYALLLPALLSALTPAYVEVARELADRPATLALLRAGFGFLLLLVPTILMGGTLPALVRYVGRDPDRFGRDLGMLYGANLAGGVAGSLTAGFVLIRWLGLQGATMAAVLGSLTVGLAALLWASRSPPAGAAAAAIPSTAVKLEFPPGARPLVWWAVFLSGVLTMAYEVLWTRILVFAFSSTVYAFTLILATFLTGLSLGSRLFVAVERRSHPLRALAAALVLAGLTSLLLTPLAARAPHFLTELSRRFGFTGMVTLTGTALAAALVILVPATFMGLVLPLGMRLLVDDLARTGRRVGAAYLVNTAGSVAGSLLAGFALIPLLGLKGGLLLLAATQVALGWAFLAHAGLSARRRVQLLAGSGVLLLAIVAGALTMLDGPAPFDPIPPDPGGATPVIEAYRDAVGASFAVVRYPGWKKALRIDGFEAASDGQNGNYMPMMTHLPMLLHPDPRRLLVICFGTGSTAGAGLLHPGASLDAVDINPTVFDLAPHFEKWNHAVARDPRARLVVDDGRNWLLTSRERYDVITSEPMPPRFAGVVSLYSREYYQLARERLQPGGLVVQWLPMHLVTYDETIRILKTVSEIFAETTLWLHESTGIMIARRDAPIRLDLERIARAFEPGVLRDDLGRLGMHGPLEFARLYALGPETIRAATAAAASITDDRPSLEFHSPGPLLHVYRGGLTLDQARATELIHRLRLGDAVPLVNATAAEAAAISGSRRLESHVALARLYVQWGRAEAAAVEFEAAARVSSNPLERAALLLEAAGAAGRPGGPGAGRLDDESRAAALPASP